jgi:hypothetical protein
VRTPRRWLADRREQKRLEELAEAIVDNLAIPRFNGPLVEVRTGRFSASPPPVSNVKRKHSHQPPREISTKPSHPRLND